MGLFSGGLIIGGFFVKEMEEGAYYFPQRQKQRKMFLMDRFFVIFATKTLPVYA